MAKHKSGNNGSASGGSALFSLLNRGLDRLAGLFSESAIVRFFCSYDQLEEYAASSFLVSTYRSIKDKVRQKLSRKPRRELGTEELSPREVGIFAPSSLPRSVKNRIGEAVEESIVLEKAKGLLASLLYLPMMSYGVFFFSFGLFTTVMQALLYFLLPQSEGAALDLFVGLALVLLSLPLMFKGYEPMLDCFRSSVTGNLLTRSFRGQPLPEGKRTKHAHPAFLFFLAGMIFGLLTFAVQPLMVLAFIAVLIAAISILYVPESGVCMLLFLLPFFSIVPHPSLLCAGSILYIGLCLLLKVMVGRRSISISTMDGLVLLFALIVLATGLAGGEVSARSAVLYASMVSGYFTLANLLRSPAWIKRSITALTASSLIVSGTGIAGILLDRRSTVALIPDTMVATYYLLAVIPLALASLVRAERYRYRLWNFLCLGAGVTYLILLGSRAGLLALIVELIFFFLFYTRKTFGALIFIVLALPVISYFVWPDFSGLTEKVVASGRGELWRALAGVLNDAPLSGVGMSDGILLSAVSGSTSVGLSQSNTFLRLLVQVGIPGLMVFLLFLLIWYAAGFTLLHKYGSHDLAAALHLALLSALTGLMVAGNFAYLWSDNRLLLLFWMSAGLARALQRVARRSDDSTEALPAVRNREDGVQCVDLDLTFTVQNGRHGSETQSRRKDEA